MFLTEVLKRFFTNAQEQQQDDWTRWTEVPQYSNTGDRRCCYTETRSYWLSVGLFAPKTNKAVDWRPAVHQESLLTTRNTGEQWYLVMNHSMAAATQ